MNIQKQILEKIAEYHTIIIHRHVIPDGDCTGSQLGLKELIRTNFTDKEVYIVGEELDYLHYVARMDTIDDSKYEGALVIVVDTSNSPRISDSRWTKGAFTIKIDHHPLSDVYADIEWVDTNYPACCEMITDLMIQNNLKTTDLGARALYNGIVSDTGRFMYRGVSERTFNCAGHLANYNFDMPALYSDMYVQTKDLARFKGYAVCNFLETKNGVAYLKLTDELLKQFNISEVSASANVNTLANIEGIKIWAFFVENAENGDIRVNLRSSGAAVNTVAIKYGGGGHLQAAGARMMDWETVDAAIADLDELAKNFN
ncbi:MAG: DHH family phosphoesterase [Turicibacter sp.]